MVTSDISPIENKEMSMLFNASRLGSSVFEINSHNSARLAMSHYAFGSDQSIQESVTSVIPGYKEYSLKKLEVWTFVQN